MDGDLEESQCPLSVTVVLQDEIDVTRGDMLVRAGNLPSVNREADAMLVWMSEQPLVPGKQYWFKHTTRRTSGEVQSIRYAIDVNTLHRRETASLKLHEIGRCRVALHDPVMFDSYRRNRQTGSFIIVDRITHETVAAGMYLDQATAAHGEEHWEDEPASRRLKRAISHIPAPTKKSVVKLTPQSPIFCDCQSPWPWRYTRDWFVSFFSSWTRSFWCLL